MEGFIYFGLGIAVGIAGTLMIARVFFSFMQPQRRRHPAYFEEED